MAPLPTIWPRLVLANSSGKVKLANDPVSGREAPIPLT